MEETRRGREDEQAEITEVVGVVELVSGTPPWQAERPLWMGHGPGAELYLVSRQAVRGVEHWVLIGTARDGATRILPPAPEAELRAPLKPGERCWYVGEEALAAVDLATPHGALRVLGLGEVGDLPLPEERDPEITARVSFASDVDGDLCMFADRERSAGWVVEVAAPEGWVSEASEIGQFVGYRDHDPTDRCWAIDTARFGTVHVRTPERPGVRLLVRDGRRSHPD